MISHVRICNYKSLGDVAVDLAPVTVIIGRSGTGKTNLVEAIRFIRDSVLGRGYEMAGRLADWARILSATASRPVRLSFEVTFHAPRVPEPYHYSFAYHQDPRATVHDPLREPSLQEERLALGKHVLFHQAGGKWVASPSIVGVPSPNGLMLGALTGLPEVTRAFVLLGRGIGWYAFPDNVLLQQPQAPPAEADQTGLADNAANYLRAFNAILENVQSWGQQDEMLAALRHINPSIQSVQPSMPERQRIVVGHQFRDKVLPLDLEQESEGVRRFLAYLLALYQTPPKQTLIFEEPEKGIHPGALALLAEEINACPDAGRGQVLLTTHSPELLNHFPPEALRVVEMVDATTRVGPVEKEQREAVRDSLLHTGELLTVDPARPDLQRVAGG